jgi:hypothetical protein
MHSGAILQTHKAFVKCPASPFALGVNPEGPGATQRPDPNVTLEDASSEKPSCPCCARVSRAFGADLKVWLT